jgi:hypothetical protein
MDLSSRVDKHFLQIQLSSFNCQGLICHILDCFGALRVRAKEDASLDDSLKAVFHSLDEIVKLRKLVSSYDDLIKRGVRLKNQRSAIFRSVGITSEDAMPSENETEHFVLQRIDSAIDAYEIDRKFYEQEFERLFKKFTML